MFSVAILVLDPVCLCVTFPILENALFCFLLNPLLHGKNVSPSVKKLWRFLKNFLVAEKSLCKALLIGRHLEISSLLLMSAENIEKLTLVCLNWA